MQKSSIFGGQIGLFEEILVKNLHLMLVKLFESTNVGLSKLSKFDL